MRTPRLYVGHWSVGGESPVSSHRAVHAASLRRRGMMLKDVAAAMKVSTSTVTRLISNGERAIATCEGRGGWMGSDWYYAHPFLGGGSLTRLSGTDVMCGFLGSSPAEWVVDLAADVRGGR